MAANSSNDHNPVLLVVDDDRSVRFLARIALEQEGFLVEEARSGAIALQSLANVRPDLILLDVEMPELNGYDTLKRLRETVVGRNIPVVMITGHDDEESIGLAYEAGATDFAAKPVNWTVLGHRLNFILRFSAMAEGLRRSEARLAHAQRMARLAWWEWDIRSDRLILPEGLLQALGISEDDFDGTYRGLLSHIHADDRRKVIESVDRALVSGQEFGIEFRMTLPNNVERFIHKQAGIEKDALGTPIRICGVFQDITERIRAEKEIRQLVYFDSITGLANRRCFHERLALLLHQAGAHVRRFAVLHIDLDRFKRINDTLGISVGDDLIRVVADRLMATLRRSDTVTRATSEDFRPVLARFGGDEFTLLLPDVESSHAAERVAERLLASLGRPLRLASHDLFVTASIGIALYPVDGAEADLLLANADTAMHFAKQVGGNQYQLYSNSMNRSALDRLVLEADLRRAMDRGEFVLFYQPQVDIETERVVGAEALLRWQHPEQGLISPMTFIPLAEETGLIVPIGEWVFRTVCHQSVLWQDEGLPALRVAINVSGRQVKEHGFLASLTSIVAETGVNPANLEIELTESVIMNDAKEACLFLEQLKKLGVRLSVDDFGTGYSSLNYLQRFPLDTLKIDRSFLTGIPQDSDQSAITRAIIALARQLNLRIIAEGVERHEQLLFLREHACDEAQGFYFSRPVPAHEFVQQVHAMGHKIAHRPQSLTKSA